MNFKQLCRIMEAKGPEAGMRYKAAMEREGPAGIVSGPIGKDAAFETKQKANNWEFNDETAADDEMGTAARRELFAKINEKKRNLRTAFRLLLNDKDFKPRITKILVAFNKSRKSWTHEQETARENLTFAVDKYSSEITGQRKAKEEAQAQYRKLVERREMLQDRLEEIKDEVTTFNLAKKTEIDPKVKKGINMELKDLKLERDNIKVELGGLHEDEMSKAYNQRFKEAQTKENEATANLFEAQQELDELNQKTDNITKDNLKANEKAVRGILFTVLQYAKELAETLKTEHENIQLTDPSQLDWEQLPTNVQEKLDRLEALSVEDENNPIVGFFNALAKQFDDMFPTLTTNQLNKKVNISSVRMFEYMPAFIFNKYWNSISDALEKEKINLTANDAPLVTDESVKELFRLLQTFDNRVAWNIPENREKLLDLVYKIPVSDSKKDEYATIIKDRWVQGKSKESKSSYRLLKRIEKDLGVKAPELQKESFDEFASKVLCECAGYDDDFYLDVVEIFSKRR